MQPEKWLRTSLIAIPDYQIGFSLTKFALGSPFRGTSAAVTAYVVNALSARMAGVFSPVSLIVAFIYILALSSLRRVVQRAVVARFTSAVVPSLHIEARRRMMASVKVAGALVEIEFAACSRVPSSAGTFSRRYALPAVFAGSVADGCETIDRSERYFGRDLSRRWILTLAVVTVPFVSFLTFAVVTSGSVYAIGVLVAAVLACRTFVQFDAVVFILSTISGQTFADV